MYMYTHKDTHTHIYRQTAMHTPPPQDCTNERPPFLSGQWDDWHRESITPAHSGIWHVDPLMGTHIWCWWLLLLRMGGRHCACLWSASKSQSTAHKVQPKNPKLFGLHHFCVIMEGGRQYNTLFICLQFLWFSSHRICKKEKKIEILEFS